MGYLPIDHGSILAWTHMDSLCLGCKSLETKILHQKRIVADCFCYFSICFFTPHYPIL